MEYICAMKTGNDSYTHKTQDTRNGSHKADDDNDDTNHTPMVMQYKQEINAPKMDFVQRAYSYTTHKSYDIESMRRSMALL